MLKPDFDIQHHRLTADDYGQSRLLMEVNPESFTYVLLSVRGMRPLVIKHFQWNATKSGATEDNLREIIFEDEFLNLEVNETFVVYNFAESSLIPEHFFHPDLNKVVLDLTYGALTQDTVLSEKIPWWELHNIYRAPSAIHRILHQKFQGARFWHFCSLQLKCHKMFTAKEEDQFIKIFFYRDKMVVFVFQLGHLQLAQTVPFADSKDVAYYLLNATQQLGLNQESLIIEVSGLIEKQSTLFTELEKYFLHVSLEKIEDTIMVADEVKELPQHYFSSLLKMAVCV